MILEYADPFKLLHIGGCDSLYWMETVDIVRYVGTGHNKPEETQVKIVGYVTLFFCLGLGRLAF